MEVKKSPKADLESKKGIFLQLGLIFALAVCWGAFEWSTDTKKAEVMDVATDAGAVEEQVQVTVQEPPKPKVVVAQPKVSDFLNIADSNDDLQDELEIEDAEADQNEEVEVQEITEDEEEEEEQIYVKVQKMPSFPGGPKAMYRYLGKNIKYPVIAAENGISGRVFIGFVVEKDGSITNVKVLRPVDPYLDKEAIRVVKAMPKWSPGVQMNKPVRVKYTVPVNFQLK
ncbi:MAG: energy transducer TonB [Marinifilaceae bacterium]|jgi:protein TonB|nr:energy transducer TonB [Marinifilaceae bacterium]